MTIQFNIEDILACLPHRPPFLLIDRVDDFVAEQSISAIKNVSMNEPFFVGHFPGQPLMPGVMMLEALAQASSVLAYKSREAVVDSDDYLFLFAGIDNARFKRMVVPGDQLKLDIKVKTIRKTFWKVELEASVDGELACSAELLSVGTKRYMSIKIDETARIHPTANIADDVVIGPWTVIGPHVEIGEGTWVGPHVVMNGPVRIGKNNKIFQFASFEEPQDKKYAGEDTLLEIGDNNIIREFVTLNRGTVQGGGVTRIGDNNLLMAYVHVAHDCIIGNHCVFSNNASLAGHVNVDDDYVIFGGFSGVHQFCNIGTHSFVAKAMVTKDVLPYVMVDGHNPIVRGLNSIGLKRHGFDAYTLNQLKKAYRIIFRKGLTTKDALLELKQLVIECEAVNPLIDALERCSRGIVR